MAIHGLGTNTQMEELIILTPENVKPVEFPNLQVEIKRVAYKIGWGLYFGVGGGRKLWDY